MRISDWSSDVCSSDLPAQRLPNEEQGHRNGGENDDEAVAFAMDRHQDRSQAVHITFSGIRFLSAGSLSGYGLGRIIGKDAWNGVRPVVRASFDRQTDRKSTRLNSSH